MMTITRRRFAAAAGAALSLPWLGWPVIAEASSAPMRFLGVRTPHGTIREHFVPRRLDGELPAGTDEPLAELTFDRDRAILRPLEAWRSKITILDGVDTQVVKEGTRSDRRTNHGHNEQGTLLTGAQPPADRNSANYDGHPSIDFWLHERLAAPVLLTACIEPSAAFKNLSYDNRGLPRDTTSKPLDLFAQAFPGGSTGPRDLDLNYGPGEQAVYEFVARDLVRLEDRLRGDEADRVREHIAAMRRVASATREVGQCDLDEPPQVRGSTGIGAPRDADEVEPWVRGHASVIAQAFACGRARCATLRCLNDGSPFFTSVAGGDFHNGIVHGYWSDRREDDLDAYTRGLQQISGFVAMILEELDAVEDPLDPLGGSVLDNTIVFWHNEFGHGGHDWQETRHPIVLAGGVSKLRMGRYLRLRSFDGDARYPHNRVLTSIAQAMGFPNVNYFGDRDLTDRAEYQGPVEPLMR